MPDKDRAGLQLALNRKNAARALDIGVDHFDVHVRPDLKAAYIGGATRYLVSELQRWLERNAC